MTTLAERGQIMALLVEAIALDAHQDSACAVVLTSERALQRWQYDWLSSDQRPVRVQVLKNRLSVLERERLLTVVNSGESICRRTRLCLY